jgi:hypothetical protein
MLIQQARPMFWGRIYTTLVRSFKEEADALIFFKQKKITMDIAH